MKKLIKSEIDWKYIEEFMEIIDSYASRKALVKAVNERFYTIKIENSKNQEQERELLENTIFTHIKANDKALTIQRALTLKTVCKYIGDEFVRISNKQKKNNEKILTDYAELCKILFKSKERKFLSKKKVNISENVDRLLLIEIERGVKMSKLIDDIMADIGYAS